MRRRLLLIAQLALWSTAAPSRADISADPSNASPSPASALTVGRDGRVTAYKLESLDVRGTTRLTSTQLSEELGLSRGIALDDELVMNTRSRLLGLGLFRSVILVMRKGSQPGMARLIVEAEDDDHVLTDWALGGELSATFSETAASAVESNTAPLDYRLGLVARNLAHRLHRGALLVDVDDNGKTRMAQIAYGLPRFALEDIQFDAELAAISVRHRYLDALGFAGRGQGLWSRNIVSYGELQYGAAMYINRQRSEFAAPGFPAAVLGPKVGLLRETRLRGFFPGEGSLLGASLLLSPTHTEQSVLELAAAYTWSLAKWAYLTIDSHTLSAGITDHALRAETRLDLPLGRSSPNQDQAEIFIRLRGGIDRATYSAEERRREGRPPSSTHAKLEGSTAIFGVRYHSSGFIAELAFKITRSPEELRPKPLNSEDTPFAANARPANYTGGQL